MITAFDITNEIINDEHGKLRKLSDKMIKEGLTLPNAITALRVIANSCHECGGDLPCQCWNDE